MKKGISFVILVLAVCFIAGEARHVFAQKKEVEFSVYSDPENKFYLKVPEGWLEADQKSEVVLYIIVETQANDPVNSLNVQKVPVSFPGEEQPKEAVDLLTQQLQDDLSSAEGFSINSDKYITVNDRLVREFDISYGYNGKNLKQTQAVLYSSGAVYVIVYTASDSVYDENIYKTALATFNFTK